MKNYVCGFLFSPDQNQIVLIEKQKPEWQRGKLNGVGGKLEYNESPASAMAREFKEEAGVMIPAERWKHFRTEHFANGAPDGSAQAKVFWFAAVANDNEWRAVRTMEDEKIVKWAGNINNKSLMYNLRYLIPMAEVLMNCPPEDFPAP